MELNLIESQTIIECLSKTKDSINEVLEVEADKSYSKASCLAINRMSDKANYLDTLINKIEENVDNIIGGML